MGHSCYRYRRSGESKPKSVQGCSVAADLSAHNLVSVKKAEGYSLADSIVPHHLLPTRASRICKLFNLSAEDDAHQYSVRKPVNKEGETPRTQVPGIQHLIAPHTLQHKQCL